MLLLSLCEIFAQLQASREAPCEGEEPQAGFQALQKLQAHEQNSALSVELKNLHEDQGARTRDKWESVTRPPWMTSLLPRWH